MNETKSSASVDTTEILRLATEIVAAYVSNNAVAANDLPAMIRTVHSTLNNLDQTAPSRETDLTPAVPIKKSVTADYIICLEDGKKLKMLKRYLRSQYGLTPEEYKARWGLPHDYPMVAPNYAAQRSKLAKQIGLGRVSTTPGPRPQEEIRLNHNPAAGASGRFWIVLAGRSPFILLLFEHVTQLLHGHALKFALRGNGRPDHRDFQPRCHIDSRHFDAAADRHIFENHLAAFAAFALPFPRRAIAAPVRRHAGSCGASIPGRAPSPDRASSHPCEPDKG